MVRSNKNRYQQTIDRSSIIFTWSTKKNKKTKVCDFTLDTFRARTSVKRPEIFSLFFLCVVWRLIFGQSDQTHDDNNRIDTSHSSLLAQWNRNPCGCDYRWLKCESSGFTKSISKLNQEKRMYIVVKCLAIKSNGHQVAEQRCINTALKWDGCRLSSCWHHSISRLLNAFERARAERV